MIKVHFKRNILLPITSLSENQDGHLELAVVGQLSAQRGEIHMIDEIIDGDFILGNGAVYGPDQDSYEILGGPSPTPMGCCNNR